MHQLPLPLQKKFQVPISVGVWFDARAVVWLGGFCQWKIPVTPSGIKPMTFWLVAPCFNQLHHFMLHVPAYTSWKRTLHVQQNSFNLTSGNSEILIIGHLRRVVPRLEILLFTSKKLHHWNRQTSGTCLKKGLQECLYQLLWYKLTAFVLFHQNFQLWRHQKTQKRTVMILHQQMKFSEWNTDQLYSPNVGDVTKNYQ